MTADSRHERVRRLVQQDVEVFHFDQPGDHVVGDVVADLDVRDGNFGQVPVVVIETDDGRLMEIAGLHQVLAEELAKAAPRRGDVLGVRYLGMPEGRRYHAYRVAVERGDQPPHASKPRRAPADVGQAAEADALDDRAPTARGPGIAAVLARLKEVGNPAVEAAMIGRVNAKVLDKITSIAELDDRHADRLHRLLDELLEASF